MASAQQIINDAHTHIGVLPAGSELGADMSNFGLIMLNRLIDHWTVEGLAIAGQAVKTIAATGVISYVVTPRPVKVESVSVIDSSGVQQNARLVTSTDWSKVPDKTRTGGLAEIAYYDGGYPSAKIFLTPMPAAGSTVNLHVIEPLPAIATLLTPVTVSTGVEKALMYNLAVDLASSLEKPVPPSVAALAASTKDALKTLIADVFGIPMSLAVPTGAKQ